MFKMIRSTFLKVSVVVASFLFALGCGKKESEVPTLKNNPNAITLTPDMGISGDLITIAGQGFSSTKASNEVYFNGSYASIMEATTEKLTVVAPQGLSTGKVEVNTQTSSGKISRISTTDFKVDATRPPIPCEGRMGATIFVIGTKAYVAGGRQSNAVMKSDMWEFDSQTKIWTKKADLPFGVVEGAFGFSINGKGYVGGGSGYGSYSGFYEYDPAANTWAQKASVEVSYPVTFVINGKGYVATGGSGNFGTGKSLKVYDPLTNVWTSLADFPGPARSTAAGFVLNNKAYVGTGFDSNLKTLKDFYCYDPATDTWTRKADFAGLERNAAVGFALGTKGYIGTGYKAGYQNDMWSYNPATDQWQQETSLQAAPRAHAMSFVLSGTAYIFGGSSGTYAMEDFREYK
jgi:N-acetylneuraminic acid mutarotase